MKQSVEAVFSWLAEGASDCKFVVTPNVDHVVNLQTNKGLQEAYEKAALVVADGKPVVWIARILGVPIPETVPGSDLVPYIFDYAQAQKTPIKVFLLGAMPGVADRAKVSIHQQWPMVEVVGTLSPEFGFDKQPDTCMDICQVVNNSGAELLVLGLGSPKQELWITQYAQHLNVKAALCVGATIDFIAGEKPRAPMWVRHIGMEWLHRVISEPRRLAKRYFIDAIEFPKIVFKEWLLRSNKT
jgi:N-acetylglucosaminyldiphosphoundecaprenol N-acetyl-beta-D-mannosaminyltransferase